MASRPAIRTVVAIIFAILVSSVFSEGTIQAAGDQYGAAQDDFQISVDYRWAGGTVGGYYPIRIGLQNRGATRELELTFRPTSGSQLPITSRRISIDQNASVSFTLLIPMAGTGNWGQLTVTQHGRHLQKLENRITLPDLDIDNGRPAVLAISPGPLDLQPLEDAFTSLISSAGHRHYMAATQNSQTIEPFRLPDNWLA
ncbi:MAG: hypothetical protein O3B86_18160, partial [Planctomycetota bacterium]|nr:hypothetical protein [Planctomycetota bacterium]